MSKRTTPLDYAWMIILALLLSSVYPSFALSSNEEADLDPIAFSLTSNKRQVQIGEEFEIKVTAVKRPNWDSRLGNTVLGSDFRMKVVFPEGFRQTGGSYSDFVYENLDNQKTRVEYTIKGHYTQQSSETTFMLLRGTKQSVELGRYLFRGEIKIHLVNKAISNIKSGNLRTQSSITCSGYTFTDGQIIGSTSINVVIHIESGCAVAYWEGGNRTNIDWLWLLNGKTIPDNILQSCVKWEGQALDCIICTTPNAPTITKTAGTTVCAASSQSVTLTASGCSGTITWFKDGVEVGTGTTITRTDPGVYTAKCTVGTCLSNASSTITVTQTSGCGSTPSITCSGYTFTEGQVIGTTSINAIIHIESGCAVAYWQGGSGGRVNIDWLWSMTGKTIPDNILQACVKWEGQALDCIICTTPNAPTITKTAGTTVCAASSQSVTLTASGCSGTITWFKDGVEVGTGTTITRTDPGVYTAKCTVGTCVSNASSTITVTQTSGCGSTSSITCSGYTFTEGQVIGTTSINAIIHIESGCAVAYWQGGSGGRVNMDWLWSMTGKTIPDNILQSCVKWEGQALDCIVCTTPNAPTITKTAGTTVCAATSQSVTLTASGCSGTITWFKDGVEVGTGTTITRTDPGVYTAKCTVGTCVSNASSTITVTQTSGCGSCAAPTIAKTSGTTVCAATSQSVTLTASGCSGTVTWFKDGVQVGTGTTITRTDAGNYTAKCTVGTCVSGASNTITITQTSGCGGGGTLTPKISSSGFTNVLNLSIVPDPANPGSWLISDIATVSLPSGYEWSYFVENKWIKRSTNLVNEPWQTNSPGRVVKMATKIGLDTLNRWPCPPPSQGGCGYYYQSDAVADLAPGARGGLTTFIFN